MICAVIKRSKISSDKSFCRTQERQQKSKLHRINGITKNGKRRQKKKSMTLRKENLSPLQRNHRLDKHFTSKQAANLISFRISRQ
jgi:hypothetical protein